MNSELYYYAYCYNEINELNRDGFIDLCARQLLKELIARNYYLETGVNINDISELIIMKLMMRSMRHYWMDA